MKLTHSDIEHKFDGLSPWSVVTSRGGYMRLVLSTSTRLKT